MDANENKKYKFGDFSVLTDINEIEYKGKRTKLTPKEMGVLIILLDNMNSTVTRAEFLSKVWGDEYGNDQGLTQAISRLRAIFSRSNFATIRTIPKKGYQLLYSEQKKKSLIPGRIKLNLSTLIILLLAFIICYLIFFQPFSVRIRVQKEYKLTTMNIQTIPGIENPAPSPTFL